MTLIKSISGIRGTIGGKAGDTLSPVDIVNIVGAYASWIPSKNPTIIIGRDARISGEMLTHLVIGTLMAKGANVVDLGMATTPTVEMEVIKSGADGGIILTASHNPRNWNALKLLNSKGEFISAADGQNILELSEQALDFATVDNMGKSTIESNALYNHINEILKLDLVDVEAITKANFKIAVDAVNSIGGQAVPELLKALGVSKITCINCKPTGEFAHNPEPLPENITEISQVVSSEQLDLGIVVDPDVDRLALVCEDGTPFGEEYTLVAVSDYVLENKKSALVANLSSTMALKDIAEKHGVKFFESAVGEVNVVAKMHEQNALIGGEGNGGIIFPELHAGRDALVGIALFLTYLAKKKTTMSQLLESFSAYQIVKDRIDLEGVNNLDDILGKIAEDYSNNKTSSIDGLKIYFDKSWVHLRKSNTEPIIRIYAEAKTKEEAHTLTKTIKDKINTIKMN